MILTIKFFIEFLLSISTEKSPQLTLVKTSILINVN